MRYLITSIFVSLLFGGFCQDINPQKLMEKTKNQSVQLSASWSVGIPMGDITQYTLMTSGRGLQFEINQHINDRWVYGGTFGWQSFFEKGEVWYVSDYSIISGIQRNYINALSFLGSSKYYFPTSANGIKAYLNLEAGASVIENYEIFGLYEYREMEWHFAVVPGMGIEIPANDQIGVQIYFKYPNSFKNNSSIHYSWLNTGIGLYLKIDD